MDPFGLTLEEQQRLAAEMLRGQAAMRANSAQGSRYDNLAAISQLANNDAAASAATMAAKAAAARTKGAPMGNMGIMLPTGEFVTNPGYVQEKLEGRAQQRGLAGERALQAAQLQRERLEAQAEQNRLNRELRADLAQQSNALRGTIAAMGKGGKGEGGKALPFAAVEKLSKKENVRDAYVDLAENFKDNFSGTPGIASVENMLGKFAPGITGKGDQANWWQNYQEQTNLVRNALFGSALTATEKAAFDAQNIVPGMAPSEIKRRLAQQAYIADQAYTKLVEASGRSGYDVSGFSPARVAKPAPAPGRESAGKVTDAPAAAPKNVPADLWQHMTPEERALWK